MNIKAKIRSGLSFLMALLLPGAQAARAAEFAADGGARAVSVAGSEQKFNEYRDIRDGVFLDDLGVGVFRDEFYLDFSARDAGRTSERVSVEGGRYGTFKASLSYDRTPHNFSEGRHILGGTGSASQTLPGVFRTAVQANEQTRAERGGVPTTDTTGEDALQRASLRDIIANTDSQAFGLERKKGAMAVEFTPTQKVKTWLKASDERRKGARQMGTGSYERYAQTTAAINGDGGHSSDMFVVYGQQVAEPIDYRTTTVNLGGGYYDKALSGDLEYTYSEFKDELDSLTWANPFRATDAAATTNADALGTDAAGASGYNRARFAKGRLGLPPSSRSHDVAASGSVELPLNGRLTAAFGLGEVSQNEDFLPYTSNTAINAAIGAPADATSTSSLPVKRFEGKVRTLTQSFALSLKPADPLSVKAKYRYYDYDNRSPQVALPGFAAYGESHWRTRRNDSQALGTGAVNEIVSYKRQTAEAGAEYEVFDPLTLGAEASWDHWGFKNNRVDATDEVGLAGTAGLHLGHALKAHGKYRWSHRAVEGYKVGATAVNPEAVGLVNYNWADRVRKRLDAGLTLAAGHGASLGLSGHLQDEDLGRQERFGLKEQKLQGLTFDASLAPSEEVELSLTLGKERRRGTMWNAAKDNAFNNTATSLDDTWATNAFNPLNYWNADLKEDVETAAVEAAFRPAEKWRFGVGYSFSRSRTDYSTSNPNAAAAQAAGYAQGTKLNNGVAQEWPSVSSKLHEVRLDGAYALTKNVSFGLDYAFARYMLSDFANVGEYPSGTTPENSTRFVLGGADKYEYTAHVVGARVAMRF